MFSGVRDVLLDCSLGVDIQSEIYIYIYISAILLNTYTQVRNFGTNTTINIGKDEMK